MAEFLAANGNVAGPVPGRLIDLREIDTGSRALMWCRTAHHAFPGVSLELSTRNPPLGSINRFKLGAGELFAIDSAPVEVTYRPSASAGLPPHLSLMVQARRSMEMSQGTRSYRLDEGDLCLIDENAAFRLAGQEPCGILFLRLPRGATLNRHPQLEKLCGTVLPASEPGTRLLADTLLRLLADVSCLGELQRAAMMDAVLQMLGVAEPLSMLPETPDWRVRRALDFIELNLSVAGLTAENVAQDQYISRRRLDQLMREGLGCSIASHLWSRRLERAAADLRDPRRVAATVAQIAFANGFEDAAHFARAFKRRYAVTPGQWRLG